MKDFEQKGAKIEVLEVRSKPQELEKNDPPPLTLFVGKAIDSYRGQIEGKKRSHPNTKRFIVDLYKFTSMHKDSPDAMKETFGTEDSDAVLDFLSDPKLDVIAKFLDDYYGSRDTVKTELFKDLERMNSVANSLPDMGGVLSALKYHLSVVGELNKDLAIEKAASEADEVSKEASVELKTSSDSETNIEKEDDSSWASKAWKKLFG